MKYPAQIAVTLAACCAGVCLAAPADTPLRIEVRSVPLMGLPATADTGPATLPSERAMLRAEVAVETVMGYRELPSGEVVIECSRAGTPSLQGAVIGRRSAKEVHR